MSRRRTRDLSAESMQANHIDVRCDRCGGTFKQGRATLAASVGREYPCLLCKEPGIVTCRPTAGGDAEWSMARRNAEPQSAEAIEKLRRELDEPITGCLPPELRPHFGVLTRESIEVARRLLTEHRAATTNP